MWARALILTVAGLHGFFLILEMFLWTRPTGLRVFRQSLEKARASRVLAANQGLYNGFLAAGLVWGAVHPDPAFGAQVSTFFLVCVIAAGVFGGATAARGIFFVQALPAAITLLVLHFT